MFRAWVSALLVMVLSLSAHASEKVPNEIHLVSEYWAGYTNADGSGLAWEIMREVFEPAQVKLVYQIEPYTRSVGLVQRGEADAWLGAYHQEVTDQVIYPQQHYDADQVVALSLQGLPPPDVMSLRHYRLAWMRGYAYQHYFKNLKHYHEIERRSGVLQMLDFDRADFYLDAATEVSDILAESEHPERYQITPLQALPVYPAFADTSRGRALAKLYDQRLLELKQSGQLQAIFQRWQQPYPY